MVRELSLFSTVLLTSPVLPSVPSVWRLFLLQMGFDQTTLDDVEQTSTFDSSDQPLFLEVTDSLPLQV